MANAKYTVWPTLGRYTKVRYCVKEQNTHETVCNVCGEGEQAAQNAQMIAQALNDAPGIGVLVTALRLNTEQAKVALNALTGAVEMLTHIKNGGGYNAVDYIQRLCEYEKVLAQAINFSEEN